MRSGEMFTWPDGDVVLRTSGPNSRDFRVHRAALSLTSSIFRDMFGIPQPPSASSDCVDIVDMPDSPQALELILRSIYPSPSPVITDLTLLSEALILADKYDIEVASPQLHPSLMEFARSEPLRVYAIATRWGFEDEKLRASLYARLSNLPGVAELPHEFEFIPPTAYDHLVDVQARYRKGIEDIARSMREQCSGISCFPFGPEIMKSLEDAWDPAWEAVFEVIRYGSLPLTYKSFAPAVALDPGGSVGDDGCLIEHVVRLVLETSFWQYDVHCCL